jgi:UDP-GlcNAc3NAcA epimerase
MSQCFFDELQMPAPKYHLAIGSGPHGMQTGRMLERIERALSEITPDRVLVYGDTNTTLAGALAAAKMHLPLAHIEAGLRSWNRAMPEEINRVVADHVADLLFAPTKRAAKNLAAEGIPNDRIEVVGDVMFDVALQYSAPAESRSVILQELGVDEYVLATVHRVENTDDRKRLSNILSALADLAEDIAVVLPLHPRTEAKLKQANMLNLNWTRIRMIPAVSYLDMLKLERNARLIATDSGGVQKEAFFFKVPCVTMRKETEWTELVEAGWNRLADPSSKESVLAVLQSALNANVPDRRPSIFGSGHSAELIAQILLGKGAAPTPPDDLTRKVDPSQRDVIETVKSQ